MTRGEKFRIMGGLKKSTAFSITKGGGLSRSLDACQSIAMLLKKKAALYIIIHKLLKKGLSTVACYSRETGDVNGGDCFFRVLTGLERIIDRKRKCVV